MKKKSNFKYFLIGILALIVVLIFINFDKIKFTIGMISSYSKFKNKEDITNVDDVDDNKELIVENPLLKVIEKEESVDKEDNSVDAVDNSNNNGESNKNGKPGEKKDAIEENTNGKSYISIVSEYNSKFESLQTEFEGDLNALISKGYAEYKAGEISTAKLANKYISEGSKLEKESDNKFYAVLKEMEEELEDNGHDTSITKDVKSYYESFKSTKKNKLLTKGKKYMD
ncbi:hypothetical protein KQI42_02350 [Tissierella sp. MSJ-40]|uniref:Lipoprotein n=1 Tax=Tissierella simiarum TaxID=2841534 RepID=A0ABS6E1P7_9FIRM|nr:hypothetical protein [Tissierella simiarum]MBU5436830.1 hypothetical protein [Tissierella simiarum]